MKIIEMKHFSAPRSLLYVLFSSFAFIIRSLANPFRGEVSFFYGTVYTVDNESLNRIHLLHVYHPADANLMRGVLPFCTRNKD